MSCSCTCGVTTMPSALTGGGAPATAPAPTVDHATSAPVTAAASAPAAIPPAPTATPAPPVTAGGGTAGVDYAALAETFIWPVPSQRITSGYRDTSVAIRGGAHTGVDFAAGAGTEIKAAASGKVVYSQDGGSRGNTVVIDHGNGTYTRYGHQSKLIAKVGDDVRQGDVIGLVGSTGVSTGPHLHFEVMRGGFTSSKTQAVDPMPFVRGEQTL